MQKKFNLVLLASKMLLLGYIIDGLNCLVWKSAMNNKRKNYPLLTFLDNSLHNLKCEFERLEKTWLLIHEDGCFTIRVQD